MTPSEIAQALNLPEPLKEVNDLALLMRHQSRGSYAYAADGKTIIGLNLLDMGLEEAPMDVLYGLRHLEALNLSENPFKEVFLSEITTSLKFVDFSDCPNLERLALPPEARHIERLDISDSKVRDLRVPSNNPNLHYFDASRNALEVLDSRGSMPNLWWLDVSGNKISDLRMPKFSEKLEYCYLGESVILSLPEEIYKGKTNSAAALKAYFEASRASGDVLNAEAKFVFFGNGHAGKTTLSKQFRKGIFDPSIKSTHGILVKEWLIEKKDFPTVLLQKLEVEAMKYEIKTGRTIEIPNHVLLNVWDFGGQEYFHATHRLFLNSNVLYMVVWETATNNQDEEVGDYPLAYWERNIAHYAPKHIAMKVQNKAQGNASFNLEKLQYKIAYRIETDQRSLQRYNLDVDTLKDAVLEQVSKLEYVGGLIPKIFEDIRNEVKRIKTEQNHLSFSDFKALCQRMDTTESALMQQDEQIELITNFLHDTGCIICYRFQKDKKSNQLDDFVFINPRWVTDTIYAILDESKIDSGEFDKAHIISVLRAAQTDIQDSNLWIELMKEFELIFPKKDSDTAFVAPQYLPKTCIDLSEKAMNNLVAELPYALVLHFPDFLPRSVISRFICRYGNLTKDEYWKYGIVFRKNDEKAMVVCDYSKQEIRISTQYHCPPIAREVLEALQEIDASDNMEISISDFTKPTELHGAVQLKKLEEQIQKGRDFVEWKGKEFETACFKTIFKQDGHVSMEIKQQAIRGNFDTEKTGFPIGEIMEVPAEPGARAYNPIKNFSNVQLLFFAATPQSQGQINTGRESRFKDLIKQFDDNRRFSVIEEHGITKEQFRHFLIYNKPQIAHYSGHGATEGIILEDGTLTSAVLKGTLGLSKNTMCVVLNACKSLEIAKELAKSIPYVIATRFNIADETSIAFARGFYQALAADLSVEDAFQAGVLSVQDGDLPNPEVLVLVKNTGGGTVEIAEPPKQIQTKPIQKPQGQGKKAFFSYSKHDRAHLDAFLMHLKPLKRLGKIQTWDDHNLKGGEEWDSGIKSELQEADIIFVLLSAHAINTDYIYDVEIEAALERHRKGEAVVVPVILSKCDWTELPIAKLNALPRKGVPITDFANADTAWYEVVQAVKQILG